jgi:flagellar basal-body rod protein FlgF
LAQISELLLQNACITRGFVQWHIWCFAALVNVSLYQAASALNANARWQEVISENMAASTIPGFKKQDLSFQAVQAGMLSPTTAGGRANAQAVSLPAARNHVNFSAGEIRRTDVNTDLAIEGTAFFEVQLPNGTTAYTRDGEFKLNAQGQLVTKQGYLVMGEGGAVQLDPNNSLGLTFAPDGTISQGADVRGKLSLVAFNDPNLLSTTGGGFFIAKDPALQPEPDSNSTLRQGFLEGSNTSAVAEMANLINVMRAYEANQRVVQMQDERMGRAISELGNPN